MKNIMSRLKLLLNPVSIGICLTIAFTWAALNYFASQGKPMDAMDPITQNLTRAHQISIDIRLKVRGERKGSPQVALLTVDEKAVETVGRWPWPREIIGKVVENAVKYGAKVLSFDMVFDQPSVRQAAEVFDEVSAKTTMPLDLKSQFQSEIAKRDSDAMLSKTFTSHASSLVLGSFGTSFLVTGLSNQFDSCMDLVFSLQPEYELWTTKVQAGVINLTPPPEVPETLRLFYIDHLGQIANQITSVKKVRNAVEKHDLQAQILKSQMEFCAGWLDPANDLTYDDISEKWAAVGEVEGADFLTRYPTFDKWAEHIIGATAPSGVRSTDIWTMNMPSLTPGEGYNVGYFTAVQDPDGTIRRSPLVTRSGNTYMPSIALKAYLVAKNFNIQLKLAYNATTQRNEIEALQVINDEGEVVTQIPVDSTGHIVINYAGKQKMFPYLSMAELLTDADDLSYEEREYNPAAKSWETVVKRAKKADFLKDKAFIVGATATGIYDLRVTPFEENFPGAETHANVLDNLIRQDFLFTHPEEEIYMLVLLLILGTSLALALTYLGALLSLLLAAAMISGIVLIDRYYFFAQGTVVTVVLPLALISIEFMVLICYKYFTEERGKKELRNTFQKYVSPAIVEEILSDPTNIELGGRKARVTIFFSDVRGFTTISEKLDPRALSDLLNEYLTPMTDLVFKNRGTLDKYMGDAIMAFFGAPIAYADHAKYGCRCALQNIEKLYELQAEFKRKGLPEIDVGIGLNTGDVSVGNMGSQTVRSYTVMGDAVNLASRLEGTNKQYGTRIIISEFTYADVKSDFICRELDLVRVKGKAQPVKIFELIAEGKTDAKVNELLKWYQEAYSLYHEKRWDRALDGFGKALNHAPADPVTKLYIERCQEYLVTPPPEDWDGVFDMKTK
jgi:adenylate cyclase